MLLGPTFCYFLYPKLMEELYETGFVLISAVFGTVNLLSSEALRERWPFEHLRSYLFRS